MIRCVHCGLLHVSSRTVCPTTGLPIQGGGDRRTRSRQTSPPSARNPAPKTPKTNRPMQSRVLDSRYRVVAAIGQGGMGTVYEAEELSSGSRVAVKVLKPEHAEKPEAVARLR